MKIYRLTFVLIFSSGNQEVDCRFKATNDVDAVKISEKITFGCTHAHPVLVPVEEVAE